MLSKRVGAPFQSDPDAVRRKRHKETFSKSQVQGKIVKSKPEGRSLEFFYCNFSNSKEVHTAIIRDSIVNGICIDSCSVLSLSGGRINDFYDILTTLKSYRNIIVAVGSNNLSQWNEPGEPCESVFQQMKDLRSSIASMEHKPKVVICTVLKRVNARHSKIQDYNSLIVKSNFRYLKLHREISKSTCFKDDGVHLNDKGLQALACAFNKAMRDQRLI